MKMGENGSTQDIQMGHCSDNTLGSEAILVFEAFVNMGSSGHNLATPDM